MKGKSHHGHHAPENEPAVHHRMKRKSGGVVVKDSAPDEVYAGKGSHVEAEAKQRKRGGKLMGKVHGEHAKGHAGRAPRKSGGRTGSNMNPLSSAASGHPAPGRNVSGSLS